MKTAKWCAPNREGNKLTCFTFEELKKMAHAYNKICINSQKIKINNQSKNKLWHNIKNALKNKCNNEICWLDQDFTKNPEIRKIIKEAFRPKMPTAWKQNMTKWFDTDNINYVMKQYENKYPDFMFIGSLPLDCTINGNLQCPLTKFDINKMHKYGVNKVGIIYNLDKSYQSGSHWMACYIKIGKKNGNIDFYDSYASDPPYEIKNLMQRIQKDLLDGSGIKMKINVNKKRFQYDFFNCGIYSMFFIIKRLEGKTMGQINKMKLDTKKMQKLKTLWYRN